MLLIPVVTVLLALLAPTTGWAHGALRRSTPADSARLTTAPRDLRLTFTERPEMAITTITLLGPAGDTIALASPVALPDSNHTVVAVIRGALTAGRYTVAWQTSGADGHPVRGRFSFTIVEGARGLGAAVPANSHPGAHTTHQGGEPAAGVAAPGQDVPPEDHHLTAESDGLDAESPVFVAARWLLFTALLALLGAVTFPLVVVGRAGAPLRPELSSEIQRRSARIGAGAGVVLLSAVLVRLALQSAAMHGASRTFDPALVGTLLGQTVWGWGWLVQLAAVLVAILGFRVAVRGHRSGWAAAAVGALVLASTPALSGHAAAAPRLVPLAIAADTLHVAGAGGWLGSLLLLLIVGVPLTLRRADGAGHGALAALVRAFSPVALACAGLTVATGVLAAWLHLPDLPTLWTTRYGWLLLGKVALVLLVAGFGAYNWRRVAPALGDATGSTRLRRSARSELAIGGLVLIVTAILVATPMPFDEVP